MAGESTKARRSSLLSRRWARSAAFVAIVAAGGFAASLLLIEAEQTPLRARTQGPTSPAGASQAAEPRSHFAPPATEPARPTSAGGIQGAATTASVSTATPDQRVRQLRELERRDPAAAALAAADLVRDPIAAVRFNAVAVLARSTLPEAADALAQLDPDTRRLALALKARR